VSSCSKGRKIVACLWGRRIRAKPGVSVRGGLVGPGQESEGSEVDRRGRAYHTASPFRPIRRYLKDELQS
jgi:hypothetical protein